MLEDEAPALARAPVDRWLTRGVEAIRCASLLADLGHEVPTALLPSFLSSTLGAPAALGLIEGIADGCAGVARFAGGATDVTVRARHADATLWITRQHPETDDETRATELTQIKPHVHRDAALAAVREIDDLLAQANALPA